MEEAGNKEYKSITLKLFVFFENIGLFILEKIHLKSLAKLYRDHIEGMRYLICGGLSTVVNIVAYAMRKLCNISRSWR